MIDFCSGYFLNFCCVVTVAMVVGLICNRTDGCGIRDYRFLQLNSSPLRLNSSRLQLNLSVLQLNSSRLQLNSLVLQLNSSVLQLN